MTTYYNPLTGQTIQPAEIGYESLTISVDTGLQWPINGNTDDVAASIMQVTATTTGLLLFLPPANQVSTGQEVLIQNVGANAFTVADYNGNTIVSIAAGIAEYIFVTDNATEAGVWSSFTFGAGTSTANAGALAGYGLKAIGATLNQGYPVTVYFSDYTIAASDRASFAVWAGGAGEFTLPSAASVGNNWFINILNNGSGILTLTPAGANTINGELDKQLQLTESLVLCSNGTNWYTFGYGRSNQFAYTQLVLTVTGGTYTLSPAQAANTIQEYQGALTDDQIIELPETVQLYSVFNNTSEAYDLTLKTTAVAGATVTVPQGSTLIVICDGTNVYNASSGTASSFASITLGNGSLGSPSLRFLGDADTGLYLPLSGELGIVVNNSLAAFFDSNGFTSINGISGGTF